ALAAGALAIVCIWSEPPPDGLAKVTLTLVILSIGSAHAEVLWLLRLQPRHQWAQALSSVAIAALAGFLVGDGVGRRRRRSRAPRTDRAVDPGWSADAGGAGAGEARGAGGASRARAAGAGAPRRRSVARRRRRDLRGAAAAVNPRSAL